MFDELVKELRDSAEWADRLAVLMGRAEGDTHAPIMRKAADAIEELQQTAEHYHGCMNEWFEAAQEYEVAVPKWIPVTERLPKIHTMVLVVDKAHDMAVGSLEKLWDGEVWVCPFADVEDEQCPITHWMPLPEPPKED